MVIINKQTIAEMLLIETLSELHQAQEKLRFFQEKYSQNFESFSNEIDTEEENFGHFDDYMEWKAYTQLLNNLKQKIEDLKYGKFQVS